MTFLTIFTLLLGCQLRKSFKELKEPWINQGRTRKTNSLSQFQSEADCVKPILVLRASVSFGHVVAKQRIGIFRLDYECEIEY